MNERGRLLAVGDIHGCLEKMSVLMKEVAPRENDTVVFLGDYINRGPESKGVVDYLLELKEKFQAVFLMGNHEKMLLDHIDRQSPSFLLNGGAKTLDSYSAITSNQIPQNHLTFFRNLLPFYETDSFIFVHAGLKPNVALEDQNINDLLWIRDEFLSSNYDWGKTIVYGHTICPEPTISESRIGIDTGCSCCLEQPQGRLTCVDTQNQQIWCV